MYYTDGGGSISDVKSAGFESRDYSVTKKEDDDIKRNRFGAENYPGGLFTVPNNAVAFNNSIGGDDGGFQA